MAVLPVFWALYHMRAMRRKTSTPEQRAAFEHVSRIHFKPHNSDSLVDIRRTRLPSIPPEETNYEPRDNRAPLSPIKVWMAYFNLLRTVCGAGMLGMPLVMSQAGIVLGPLMTIFTGVLITHTHFMLLNTLNEISRQLRCPYVSYRYGFRLALLHGPPIFRCLGKRGPESFVIIICLAFSPLYIGVVFRQIIGTFMFLSQLGICTVFVLFTTDSLRDIMDWQSSNPALLCLLFPYLLMQYLMKSLRIVSYVAMIGNILNMIAMGFLLDHIINDPNGEVIKASTNTLSVMFAFGSLLFNMSVVGVTLSIDKGLKEPRKMVSTFGVLNIGIGVPTVIAVIFGCLGYWAFGTMEENILRSLPVDEATSIISIALYLVAVAFAYPLQCHPAIATVVETIKYHDPFSTPSEETLILIRKIGRPLFVLLSFFIAYLVPFQGPFVAFVGNLCTSMLSLVFPALMDICVRYPYYYGRIKYHLIKDLVIMFLGLIAGIFGVYYCGYLIHIRMLSKFSPNMSGYF